MRCPKCDTEIATDAAYCPECGLHVAGVRSALAGGVCPRCDAGVPRDRDVCQSCGLQVADLAAHLGVDPADPGPTAASDPGTGPDRGPDADSGAPGVDRGDSGDAPAGAAPTAPDPDEPRGGGRTGPGPVEAERHGAAPGGEQATPADAGRPAPPPGSGRDRGGRMARATSAGGDFLDGVPVARAAGLGALAYALQFAVVYWLVTTSVDDGAIAEARYGTMEMAGWAFYGAHNVPVETVGRYAFESANYLHFLYSVEFGLRTSGVPQEVFYLVPMVGLYLVGLACVRWLAPDGRRPPTRVAARVGVPAAVTYAGLFVFGAVSVFRASPPGPGEVGAIVGPDLGGAVLMGVVYPVVLAGVGGVVGSQ